MSQRVPSIVVLVTQLRRLLAMLNGRGGSHDEGNKEVGLQSSVQQRKAVEVGVKEKRRARLVIRVYLKAADGISPAAD